MDDNLAYALGFRFKVILGRVSAWGRVLYAVKLATANSMSNHYSVPGRHSIIVPLNAN